MKITSRNFSSWLALIGGVLLATSHTALGADVTFDSNVNVNSNLIVKGTVAVTNNVNVISNLTVRGSVSVTNIVPNQPNTSLYLLGANSDGNDRGGDVVIHGGAGNYVWAGGGNVVITGGPGDYEEGGDVVLQGGTGGFDQSAGNVILRNRINDVPGYGGDGYVTLQTADHTTRFRLQTDGTLNANNNAITGLGALTLGGVTITNWLGANGTLSATNITPSQANQSISISGADSSGFGFTYGGGAVVISGGSGDTSASDDGGAVTLRGGIAWGGHAGDVSIVGGYQGERGRGGNVILQGGAATGDDSSCGSVILKNVDSDNYRAPGYVMLQTSDGTTRFWLQSDGTLNANNNYIAYARVRPQGDLAMGSFTNSP